MSAKKPAFEPPNVPTGYNLDVLVMPNGEIMCAGLSLGFADYAGAVKAKTLGSFLTKKEPS